MVFLALPALQVQQKNSAIKQEAARVASALNTWYADNQGSLTDGAGNVNPNLNLSTLNPYIGTTNALSLEQSNPQIKRKEGYMQPGDHTPGDAVIYITAVCNAAGTGGMLTGATSNNAVVVVRLAAVNSTGKTYCVQAM